MGLIFDDLKTLLRQLGRDDGEPAAAPAEAAPVAAEDEAGGDALSAGWGWPPRWSAQARPSWARWCTAGAPSGGEHG